MAKPIQRQAFRPHAPACFLGRASAAATSPLRAAQQSTSPSERRLHASAGFRFLCRSGGSSCFLVISAFWRERNQAHCDVVFHTARSAVVSPLTAGGINAVEMARGYGAIAVFSAKKKSGDMQRSRSAIFCALSDIHRLDAFDQRVSAECFVQPFHGEFCDLFLGFGFSSLAGVGNFHNAINLRPTCACVNRKSEIFFLGGNK